MQFRLCDLGNLMFWKHLGVFWEHLGVFWGHFGGKLGRHTSAGWPADGRRMARGWPPDGQTLSGGVAWQAGGQEAIQAK